MSLHAISERILYKAIHRLPSVVLMVAFCVFLAGCSARETVEGFLDSALGSFLESLIDDELWESQDKEIATTVPEKAPIDIDYKQSDEQQPSEPAFDDMGAELTDEQAMLATDGMIRYFYSKLGDRDKRLYRDIYSVLMNHATDVVISSLDADDVDRVFQLVMNDHPEIFYVKGYSMNKYMVDGRTASIEFSGTYTKTPEEIIEDQEYIDIYTNRVLLNAPEESSDYDKVKYVYEYIIDNTEYDLNAPDDQDIVSVFRYNKSVCQGYAKATQYLLCKLGIPCILVSGVVNKGDPHAWNMAYVDGVWTCIDTTWGDASYRNLDTNETWNEITYDYLCVGSGRILETHTPDDFAYLPVTHTVKAADARSD